MGIANRSSKPKRPRDPNQLAKAIVDEATKERPAEIKSEDPPKDPTAVSLGKRGGLKGGPARAKKLSKARRREMAKKAAEARWNGKSH